MNSRHFVALVLIWLRTVAAPAAAQPTDLEYDVRAAFLLNFTRYVEWPANRSLQPFRMCVLGKSRFGPRLEAAMTGETWHQQPITVHTINDLGDLPACDLLYVPAEATDHFLAHQNTLETRPILTVGETTRFLTGGGMIQLFVEDNRVRFSINLASATLADLTISSRLLRLARQLIPSERGL
jgi:uncharacterized protein DUF4154